VSRLSPIKRLIDQTMTCPVCGAALPWPRPTCPCWTRCSCGEYHLVRTLCMNPAHYMNPPVRVQIRRTKGWRRPPNTMFVARPSLLGNPYSVAEHGRAEALRLYREWIMDQPELIEMLRRDMRGLSLACWCPPGVPCHADILLEIANA
jgi:hypothetical protein